MSRAATAPFPSKGHTQLLGAALILFAVFELGYMWKCNKTSASQEQMLGGFVQRHGQAADVFAAKWRSDHALPTAQNLRQLEELTRAYDADPSRLAMDAAVAPSGRNAATFWKERSMDIHGLLTSWWAFALSALVSIVVGLKLLWEGRAIQRDAAKDGQSGPGVHV